MTDGPAQAPEAPITPIQTDAPPSTGEELSEHAIIEAALATMPPDEPDEGEPPAPPPEKLPAEGEPPADGQPPQEGDGDALRDKEGKEGEQGEPKEGDQKTDPQERAWSRLREREAKLTEARAELKAERESIQLERDNIQRVNQAVQQMRADVRADPLRFIQEQAGYTMDDLVQIALGDKQPGGQPPPTLQQSDSAQPQANDPVRAELQELKSIIQQQQANQHIAAYRNDIAAELAKPENELLANYTAFDQYGNRLTAAQVIEARASQLAATASPEEQLDLSPSNFAATLLGEYRESLSKSGTHSAVREALGNGGAQQQAPQSASPNGNSQPQQQPPTLTNRLAATPPRPADPQRPLDPQADEEELINLALQHYQEG